MTMEYGMGVTAGIVCAVIFLAITTAVKRGVYGQKACEYDERQTIARGKAYKIGMFTICGCNALFGMLHLMGIGIMDAYTAMLTSMIIGIGAFAVTAIRHDAYQALHGNMRRWYILGTILFLANLFPSAGVLLSGEMYKDGKLHATFLSLLLAILWGILMITQFLHDRALQREEEA